MAFRIHETGKRIAIITSFDMSANTSLAIKAKAPSGAVKTWTATLGAGVLTNIETEDGSTITTVAANQWMYYDLASTSDLDEVGDWTLTGLYHNTSASPADYFIADPVVLSALTDNFS